MLLFSEFLFFFFLIVLTMAIIAGYFLVRENGEIRNGLFSTASQEHMGTLSTGELNERMKGPPGDSPVLLPWT